MPEMEKGRPPENKRSRKPAHPVKREINQEMKSFAESTMNELLGWYGYDKVELRDTEATEIRTYPNREHFQQHVSVLKENSVSKPKILNIRASDHQSIRASDHQSIRASDHQSIRASPSVPAMRSGERELSSVPSSSSSLISHKEHKSAPVIVPLIKPSAVEDVQNVQIVCVWCQKEGVKRYSLCMGSELKSFCSEKCFAACRRAYFKRNKARDENLVGEDRSPQHTHADDTPRQAPETNSGGARSLSPIPQVCDWCKHVRHTKEYLDFGAGEERLQFCSTKCLNQYKMDVFYREARATLTSSSPGPGRPPQEGRPESNGSAQNQKLLTPESWSSGAGEPRLRIRSPRGPTPTHGTAAPRSVSPAAVSSLSSKVSVSGLRHLERHVLPPPPPTVVVSHPAAPPPPPPPPPHHRHPTEHHHHQHHQATAQFPLPFIRPPLHAQGLKSPLANHPRTHPVPPSSPILRPPPHSPRHPHPHLQPPSTSSMNPPGMHPYPGAYYPGLHSPPLNMLGPRGPVPMPPMMNFMGWPSMGPFFPQPTVLVPYPIIIPIPIPIPIPILVPPKGAPSDPPGAPYGGVIQPVPDGMERGYSRGVKLPSPGSSVANRLSGAPGQGLGLPFDPTRRDINDWVKRERKAPSPLSTPHSAASSPRAHCDASPSSSVIEGLTDFKPERQVIQRVLQRTSIKSEPSPHAVMAPLGPGDPEVGQDARAGIKGDHHPHEIIKKNTPPPSKTPPQDSATQSPNVRPPSYSPLNPQEGGSSPCNNPTSSTPTSADAPDRKTPSPGPESSGSLREAPPQGSEFTLSKLEAVKKTCSNGQIQGRNQGQTPPVPISQSEEPSASNDSEDPHVLDEDHAYALPTPTPTPTPPRTDSVLTSSPVTLLLPKLRDKGSLRSPPGGAGAGTGTGDMEPAAKRRCLRIRDQNK
ncbi:hypothetical protein DPEC_G00319820 [Dallia pectoralis]|uniref:Uncharacterized protein n=1 Tax=Dallia pectoralis TaxID=75939 RepID=A0ACC2F9V7_DALPE|nr:hypothetical protein DPEC_G00319820 [Dallia pectoralis]